MGYVYELTPQGRRLLCCDVCGHAGGVRRMRCKYGWCQPTAMCASCRANPKVRAEQAAYCDEHCRQAAAEYAEREERKVALLDSGAFVRTSALGCIGTDKVAVTFRNAEGREVSAEVSREAYRSVPLLEPATPSDFGISFLVDYERRETAEV